MIQLHILLLACRLPLSSSETLIEYSVEALDYLELLSFKRQMLNQEECTNFIRVESHARAPYLPSRHIISQQKLLELDAYYAFMWQVCLCHDYVAHSSRRGVKQQV